MVGFVTENDDLILIIGLVIITPFLIILGIPLFLASLGANGFVVFFVGLLNTALVAYLIYRWQLVQTLQEAFSDLSKR